MTRTIDFVKLTSAKKIVTGIFFCMLCFSSLRVDAQLNANFTADSTSGCELLSLALTNLSTGATSYLWEIYDAGGSLVSSSTLTNPTFFLISPGAYTVSLTAYDAGGGSDNLTITNYAYIYTNPVAEFLSSATEGCPGTEFTFIDNSIPGGYGSIDDYYWVITGAPTLPSTPSINYSFSAPGTYTVYLFVTDGGGCSDYVSETVTIFDSVHADFTSDVAVSCSVPITVNFTNLSTGTGSLTYEWDFGDGGSSTDLNPSYTYSTYGTYDVTLIVTNADGCTDTITLSDYVSISPTADIDFTVSPDTICVGESVTFDNLAASSTGSWDWSFGDGGTSTSFEPTHTYTTAGTYSVTLDADFGGGCTGSIAHANIITVLAAPIVSFTSTSPYTVCENPFSVSFTSVVSGGPVSYLWTFEDVSGTYLSSSANPTYTWTALGSYDVSLTVTNSFGCSATYSVNDYVTIDDLEITPVASPIGGCKPLTVNFSATAGETLVTYEWELGDGTSSSSSTPSGTYDSVGCYTVTIIGTSVSGCVDTTTIVDLFCVGDTGTAQLVVPDTACPGTPLEVYYLPLDSITAIIDGGFSTSITTSVDSTTVIGLPTGDHNVDFITWSHGCPDTLNADIHILEVVDSLMQVDYTCDDPYTVQIHIDTTLASMSCGWVWEFGDGTTDSVSTDPFHTYAEPGTYNVVVIYECITDIECQGTGVTVYIQIPEANYVADPPFGCDTPFVAVFENLSTDYINDDLTYEWDFGDGSPLVTTENPTHTYYEFEQYFVTLTVTDNRGCIDSFTDTVGISQVTAGYTLPDAGGCAPFTISLTDTSSSLYGEITTWIIDWGDDETDTFYNYIDVVSLEHTFYENANYYVTLTAIDEFGCTDDYVDTIKAGLPVADFFVDDTIPCIGQLVYFTEEATGFGLDFSWDFGDGTTSDLANATHTYSALGYYDVTLIVEDVNGCTDTIVKPSYILTDTVYVDFTASVLVASCNYSLIEFNSVVTDSICEYLWEFGDGGISVDPNPVYPYLAAGEYSVSLTVTDCNDCSSTIYKIGYVVVPGPYGTITFSDDTICADHEFEIYISVASTDTLTLYLDNGDVISLDVEYSDSLTTITVPYTYTASGIYYPTALLVDTNSCLGIISGMDSVWVGNDPDAQYLVPDPILCIGTPITFADSSSGPDPIVLWVWNTGDSILYEDSSEIFNYYYSDTGFYNTSLFVYTQYGCYDSMFADVNVLPYPEISLTGDSTICPGQSVQLDATGGTYYSWTPSAGLSDTTIANPIATPNVTTLYIVDVSNGYCSSFDSVLVSLVDDLILYAGPDTSLCIGDMIQLYSEFITDVSINNITYSWTPPDYLSDPYIQNPVSSALDDIVYTIYASCGNLNDSADADIKISTPPDIEIPEDTITIINGQSANLTSVVLGGDPPLTYEWQPFSEVDCPSCESVTVTPYVNTIYSCQVTDIIGCTDIDFVLVRVLTCDEQLFFIPNIMTPNGDGWNDVFKFNFEGGVIAVEDINIYNRWGELMFHTDNIDEYWDGTYNGELCNPGVYVYTFVGVCLDGTETIVSGNVTLVK